MQTGPLPETAVASGQDPADPRLAQAGGLGPPPPVTPRLPVRPVFPGRTITATGEIVDVVSFATLLQALDALRELP